MQRYVAEPSDKLDGTYCVSVWNAIANQYEVIERDLLSEYEAKEKACQLNEQYERQNYEFEHQNELIDKYHDYAVSGEIQKQNAAREFFKSFPYQRETCEQILKQLEDDIVW